MNLQAKYHQVTGKEPMRMLARGSGNYGVTQQIATADYVEWLEKEVAARNDFLAHWTLEKCPDCHECRLGEVKEQGRDLIEKFDQERVGQEVT